MYVSVMSKLLPPLLGVLADLPRAASTGPAFEPPLLVWDGPVAALSGETSCSTCGTLHPAVETQRQKSHVNLDKKSTYSHLITNETRVDSLRHLLRSHRLLLAEEETAELWIGSWV